MADEKFDVRATDPEGRDASGGEVAAGSVEELVSRLRKRGLEVSGVTTRRGRRFFEPRGCGPEEFAVFNAELAAVCRRGVPLPGALRALSRALTGRVMREAVEAVAREVEAGKDLADALSARPDCFPPGYVVLVEAGLATGDLPGTLLLFSNEARLNARVRRNVTSALLYPLIVLLLASSLLALIGWSVVPEVRKIYAGSFREPGARRTSRHRTIPLATRLIFRAAPFLRFAPPILLGLMAAAAAAWLVMGLGAPGERRMGLLQLNLPFAGRFFRAVAMTRFSRTLAQALAANVPVPEAVGLAGLAAGNAAVRAAAEEAVRAVREGQQISRVLEATSGIFPATLVWMLSVGESRGEAAEALREYARLQEESAERLGALLPTLFVTAVTILTAATLFLCVYTLFQPLAATVQEVF